MADNLTTQTTVATPPSGSVIAARQTTYSGDSAYIAPVGLVAFSGSDDAKTATDIPGSAANGLTVDVTRVQGSVAVTGTFFQGTQPVSGTVAVSGVSGTVASTQSGTWTVQPGNTANTTAWKVDGSAVTQPVSGTVSITANSAVNVAQLAGSTTDTGSGVKSAGTLRVVIANDQPQLTNKILVTPDSVALPANQSVNVSQINGVTPLMGAGNTGTGSPRVTIATDQVAVSAKLIPQTTGGLTTYHLASAGSTNAVAVKGSAGQLFGWYIYNSNAAARKLTFHNSASAPTAGASVFFSVVVPPTSAANVFSETGIAFSTGIGITTVTGLADSDNTAVAANDLIINLFYA